MYIRIFQRDRGGKHREIYVAQLVVRIFSISKDFPERQGRELNTEIYVVQLVVRIFSISKDFPERQGRETQKDICSAVGCKDIFH